MKITIYGNVTTAPISSQAVRIAHSFADEYPQRDRGTGKHRAVVYRSASGTYFCAWWTKAGNVTVYIQGGE